jgi:hypothetical protein
VASITGKARVALSPYLLQEASLKLLTAFNANKLKRRAGKTFNYCNLDGYFIFVNERDKPQNRKNLVT